METIEQRLERLEYYQSLILQFADNSMWPFYHIAMIHRLTEQEIENVFHVCESLHQQYKEQKAEGFINFSPLLIKFEQSIPKKLPLLQTIDALYQQKLFIPLMEEFKINLSDGLSRKY
jgi:hypothetical protein